MPMHLCLYATRILYHRSAGGSTSVSSTSRLLAASSSFFSLRCSRQDIIPRLPRVKPNAAWRMLRTLAPVDECT